jgi:hypothetical protein
VVQSVQKVGCPGHPNYVGLVVTNGVQLSGHLVIDITRNLRQLGHDRLSETKRPRRAIFIHESPRKVDLHQVATWKFSSMWPGQTVGSGAEGGPSVVVVVLTNIELSGHLVGITRDLRQDAGGLRQPRHYDFGDQTRRRVILIQGFPRKADLHQVGFNAQPHETVDPTWCRRCGRAVTRVHELYDLS